MPLLPFFQTNDKDLTLLQNRWSSILNQFLKRPQNLTNILANVQLAIGDNFIPTGLDQPLQGWSITRQRAAAGIYDDQDNNPNPATSLKLVSDAVVSVDLEVF